MESNQVWDLFPALPWNQLHFYSWTQSKIEGVFVTFFHQQVNPDFAPTKIPAIFLKDIVWNHM